MRVSRHGTGIAVVAGVALLVIAIPVLGASPSPSAFPATASPVATAVPVKPAATAKPDKTAKPEKGPETELSLTGTIHKTEADNGRATYTMSVDGTTWELSAGPPWFWGDANPLDAYVGRSVTVTGTTRASESEIDVEAVDGTVLRAPGKPPWAGGPWVVGSTHPGWKDWMADGKPGKGHGRDGAPGQLKKATPAP